jgi:magnesium transporter
MDPNCWINIECPTERKNIYEELQILEAFIMTLDIDETKDRKWLDVNYHANSVKSNDVKLPFHTIPVGVVLKVKFALPLVFIKQKCFLIL